MGCGTSHPESVPVPPALEAHVTETQAEATASLIEATPPIEPFSLEDSKELRVIVYSAKQYVRDFLETKLLSQFPHTKFLEEELDATSAHLAKGCHVVVIFVTDLCNREVVTTLAKLGVKLIALRCATYDRVDLKACAAFAMRVVSVPLYSPQSVAEHAVALAFTLNRKLHLANSRVKQGNYALSGLVGRELTGKTIGIIGTGATGMHACRIFKGIGMRVLAYDYRGPKVECEEMGVEYMDLEDLLPQCDVVSLHCQLVPETKTIMNRARMALLKHGVMLINVSKGLLIDSEALFEALENGQIGALGLDVYENEADLFFEDMTMFDASIIMQNWDRKFRTLISYPQVLVTPHTSFLTVEALEVVADTTVANLREFATGNFLTNQLVWRPRMMMDHLRGSIL